MSVVLAAALLICAAAVSSASAATPAAVDEYQAQQPTSPVAGGGTGTSGTGSSGTTQQGTTDQQQVAGQNAHGNGNNPASGAAGTEAVSGGSGGSLPFTGYPMAPIVWVFLALLGAGLAIRLGLAAYRRTQRPGRPDPPNLHLVR